jgi:hypothetical protein
VFTKGLMIKVMELGDISRFYRKIIEKEDKEADFKNIKQLENENEYLKQKIIVDECRLKIEQDIFEKYLYIKIESKRNIENLNNEISINKRVIERISLEISKLKSKE